ncbi:MAG TPA: hypothetical protein VE890_15855, partial [Thermoguttaceae bacterium]|nr:hypothetical protein [Thermoguttaceae bacterium]
MSQNESNDPCQCPSQSNAQRHSRNRWLTIGSLIVGVALGAAIWHGAVGQDPSGVNLPALQAAETAIAPVVDPEAVSHAKSLSSAFR